MFLPPLAVKQPHRGGAPQDSPRVWGLPAEQPDAMQALLTARELQLPQRAGHHSVRHFTGLLHCPKYLQRQCLEQVRKCMCKSWVPFKAQQTTSYLRQKTSPKVFPIWGM